MENIAYVQFDSVETAKKYKEMDLEINSVPISSKFVPDRMSAERKRTKGTKWEKKKAAKREAVIAEKKALKVGIRRAVRRVHRSAYGRVFFLKIGTYTKFDLGNNPLGLFLLFGAN